MIIRNSSTGLETELILATLLHGNQLKRTTRTGWVQRGVPDPENVAAHTFGVAFVTLILAPMLKEPIDLGTALALAILHDLPEGVTSDIPRPAWQYLPENSKVIAEHTIMKEIMGDLDEATRVLKLWAELQESITAEARLVHDADKIDLYLQALVYEQQTGNRMLEEFWIAHPSYYFACSLSLYEAIRDRRIAGKEYC